MDKNTLIKLQSNPEPFLRKVLGVKLLEPYHLSILEDVAKYDKVAISACHALGKTWILARVVLWFLFCYVGNTVVITTAPTSRQVKALLWGEIRSAFKAALFNLGGNLSTMELKISDKWYAMGFSPAKTAGGGDDTGEQKGSTFQGFHADNVLVVFDEAVGVPHDIWTQVEGLLTSGAVVKFVCIANPTTKNCNFFECFSMASWRKIHLSCFDSPNMIANGFLTIEDIRAEVDFLLGLDEGDMLDRIKSYKKPVSHLLSAQWVIEKALPDEWGIEHPLFQSKVLGQFPDIDDTVLIQTKDVKIAQARTQMAKDKGVRYIGIDVARFGDDRSVWTELVEGQGKIEVLDENNKVLKTIKAPPVHTRTKKTAKQDLMATVGHSVRFIMDDYEGQDTVVVIDATGVGSGVYDRLIELQKEKDGPIPRKIKIVELHYGASVKSIQKNKKKPTKKEKQEQDTYLNVKALMFAILANSIKNEIRLRKDAVYSAQLPTIKYTFNSTGKMVIESKKDYKKRTGKPSPDEADSLAMANLARRLHSYGDYLRKIV